MADELEPLRAAAGDLRTISQSPTTDTREPGCESEWLGTVLDALPVGMFMTNASGDTLYWNARLRDFTGLTLHEAMGAGWFQGVHPEDRDRTLTSWNENVRQKRSTFEAECRFVHGNGSTTWAIVRVQAQTDDDGRIVAYMGTVTDVSARREVEQELERLAEATENAGEGITIWNSHGVLEYYNQAFAHVVHADPAHDLRGTAWEQIFTARLKPFQDDMRQTLEKVGRLRGHFLARGFDGSEIPVDVTLTRVSSSDHAFRIVGSFRDRTTEQHHLDQIRRLSADANELLEAERARLSRELHDHFAQLLTAANLSLAWIGRRVSKIDAELSERLEDTQKMIHDMASEVRSLSKSLRPPILDHGGLLPAIESHVAEFQLGTGIRCGVDGTLSSPIAEPIAITAYRVLQEALTNAARHSYASSCRIELREAGHELILIVQDDGRGFDIGAVKDKPTLGLTGMEERVISLGGRLIIESRPGEGCRITACLPVGGESGG